MLYYQSSTISVALSKRASSNTIQCPALSAARNGPSRQANSPLFPPSTGRSAPNRSEMSFRHNAHLSLYISKSIMYTSQTCTHFPHTLIWTMCAENRTIYINLYTFIPLSLSLSLSLPIPLPPKESSWQCSIVVKMLVSTGELSLSCTRLLAGWATTLSLSRLLSVNQKSQLSHPSLRGR